jgi:transcription-repair-coupling factor
MIFLQLIQSNPAVYRFDGPHKFRFTKDLTDYKVRLEFVTDLVKELIKKERG